MFRNRFVNVVSEFPWVIETRKRLGGMELSQEDLHRVLTFVTCVYLIKMVIMLILVSCVLTCERCR